MSETHYFFNIADHGVYRVTVFNGALHLFPDTDQVKRFICNEITNPALKPTLQHLSFEDVRPLLTTYPSKTVAVTPLFWAYRLKDHVRRDLVREVTQKFTEREGLAALYRSNAVVWRILKTDVRLERYLFPQRPEFSCENDDLYWLMLSFLKSIPVPPEPPWGMAAVIGVALIVGLERGRRQCLPWS